MISRVELHWTHRQAGSVTHSRFLKGVVHLRSSEESYCLSPSAAQ
jgi:hypothetical protein